MKIVICWMLFLLFAMPAAARGDSVVLYLDGARFEREIVAPKAYLEIPLPASMIPGTLRLKPLSDVSVTRFEVVIKEPGKDRIRELARLEERKKALKDRLEVLEEREEIFAAAVKTQSSRALRKTKNNPDPAESARKGTELALSQLTAAHGAGARARSELESVEARLASFRKAVEPRASLARVWLSGPGCRIRVAYLVTGLKWTPNYDFRLQENGFAEVVLRSRIPPGLDRAAVSVVPLPIADAFGAEVAPCRVSRDGAVLESHRLVVTREEITRGPVPFLSFTFVNGSGKNLPPGDATGFWRSECLGKSPFAGARTNETTSLVFGKP